MRIATLGFTLGLVTAVATPAFSAAKAAHPAKGAKVESTIDSSLSAADQQKLREHLRLREHVVKGVKYPATKHELVSSCKNLKGVNADDKKWFEETLPDKTFASSGEVVKALGWEATPPDADKTAK
jgi:hypothetical protein